MAIPDDVRLVAVSKFQPVEMIWEAYMAGQREFGESRPKELAEKHKELPKDIEWHMIGHLQTNKIKLIAPFVSMIQSVDSLRLAIAISDEAHRLGRVIDVLLEVHIADEDSKFGLSESELERLLSEGVFDKLPGINVRGLMGMATYTQNKDQISREFESLREMFDRFKAEYLPSMDTLSMGMSEDYSIAVKHGSNMVRIGSKIFGDRNTVPTVD